MLKCSCSPEDYLRGWEKFYSKLISLSKMKMIAFKLENATTELYGFADSFLKAYGAPLYLRVLCASLVMVSFLCLKTKVSATISFPRFEFNKAHVLTKSTRNFINTASLGELKIHSWSVSKDVLA